MALPNAETVEQAFWRVHRERWYGRRSEKVMQSQGVSAAKAVAGHAMYRISGQPPNGFQSWLRVALAEVTGADVKSATAFWYRAGLSPETINKRLCALSAMGIACEGNFQRKPKVRKWWLSPERQEALCVWLMERYAQTGKTRYGITACYVRFVCRTGLRVEEALRLSVRDMELHQGGWRMRVPGTKTEGSDATLTVGREVWLIRDAALSMTYGSADQPAHHGLLLFPLSYAELNAIWQECREFLGEKDDPMATLKALRRSAAYYLHVTLGMPILLVRDYLRHDDVETTMSYLRLTGGVADEEYRRYLK